VKEKKNEASALPAMLLFTKIQKYTVRLNCLSLLPAVSIVNESTVLFNICVPGRFVWFSRVQDDEPPLRLYGSSE